MSLRAVFLAFLACFPLWTACGRQASDGDRPSAGAATDAARSAQKPTAEPEQSNAPRIIVLGDSLTAGLGIDVAQSFPSKLEQRLKAAGYPYDVLNAGVSGDTSAGGLRRLDWAMSEGTPRVLIVALGGNDGLRGLPPEQLESNLSAIIEKAKARGLIVIVAGMEAPPNFGADYTSRFRQVYPAVAASHKVPLIPFLLEGVAGNPSLNQADGIHPNSRGAEIVADVVWKTLEPELARARATESR